MKKLIKNISLLALTALFIIINSGFTATLYFCRMEKSTSFSSCGMCEEEVAVDDCCADEDSKPIEPVISSIPAKCCEVIHASILGTDDYFVSSVESGANNFHFGVFLSGDELAEYSAGQKTEFKSDSSPPLTTNTKLFLSNKNFRI